jgi:hypothetical protein
MILLAMPPSGSRLTATVAPSLKPASATRRLLTAYLLMTAPMAARSDAISAALNLPLRVFEVPGVRRRVC